MRVHPILLGYAQGAVISTPFALVVFAWAGAWLAFGMFALVLAVALVVWRSLGWRIFPPVSGVARNPDEKAD